jgi:tetratricopeptide (TPR) repeat protein
MTWVVFLASIALSCVAAAGVLLPFSRSRQLALEPPPDPLDDERTSLLRRLRDLQDEHATGQLSDEAYRPLRQETEARAVMVLRALELRGGADVHADLREFRPRRSFVPPGDTESPTRSTRMRILTVVAVGLVVAVVAVVLARAIQSRSAGQPITGTVQGGLAFFEQRVGDHPDDVAARLDLAQRYLETGNGVAAAQQYVAVLQLDPENAEAHAQLGFLYFVAGRASDGLEEVEQALVADPGYPEALYVEGVILLKGLSRPADAADAFKAYLAAAPFGAHREEVQQLLGEAEGAAG